MQLLVAVLRPRRYLDTVSGSIQLAPDQAIDGLLFGWHIPDGTIEARQPVLLLREVTQSYRLVVRGNRACKKRRASSPWA